MLKSIKQHQTTLNREGNIMKIQNMVSSKGNKVTNQFLLTDVSNGFEYFQSYNTMIAKTELKTGKTWLDSDAWNYSVTTAKYRNNFTGLTTKQTQSMIDSGEIELINLNEEV